MSRWYARSLMVGAALYAFGAVVPDGYAQFATAITPDGTLGTTVARSGNVFNINDGTIRGSNQFHSFGLFNVGTGDIASFNGPVGIQNIVSRVTGGVGSAINGTLRSTIAGANLFLLNPAGILFGPNAALNVSGSFHASTGDYVKLGTDGVLYADPVKASVLTSAPPSAFGFLTSNPAGIDVQAGVFSTPRFTNVLQVPVGKTLSFVGGPVNVGAAPGATSGGFLFAPGGRINLVSVASAGEAGFDGTGFSVASFPQLGSINIKGNSIIDGREVFIRGGQLTIDGASIFPGFFSLTGAPFAPPNGGEVNIAVSGGVNIIGRPPVLATSGIQTFAGSASSVVPGDVPNITIKSSSVSVSQGALVQTVRQGPGNPSNLLIEADTVDVLSGASVGLRNLFQGPGGAVTVNARDVTLDSAGSSGVTGLNAQANFHPAYGRTGVPFLSSLQLADSGSITVNATGKLTVRGRAQISTDSFAFGRGGNITINAGDMLLVGAGINTATIAAQSALSGQSGDVTINAAGSIDIQNGFRISANTLGSSDGGQANIRAGGSITMTGDSTVISSATDQPLDSDLSGPNSFTSRFQSFFGLPDLNYSTLRAKLGIAPATGDLMQVLAALNGIKDASGNPLVAVTDFTPGTGGRVSIAAPVLTANAGARIETSTGWDGNAGAVVANVGSLFLHDGAVIDSRSGAVRLDRGFTVGKGNAGTVDIAATDNIEISGRSPTSGEGSTVTTSTFGNGNAGNISLSANQVNVQNGGSVTSASGGTLAGQFFVGSGNAGQINVSTPTLTMADGGTISVATSGAGNAGNIALNVTNFTQTGGARVDSSTLGAGRGGDLTVTAANSASISGSGTGLFSTASSTGAGGDIKIQAGQLVQLTNDATFSAQSTGTATATAGNIIINAPTFEAQNSSVTTGATLADGGNISVTTTGSLVHLTDSQITTSVQSGVGGGGNIAIDSKLIVLDESQILANAFGGPGGNININSDVFLVNSGGTVPTSLAGIVDASSALSTSGTVNIEATFTNVVGTVAQLPSTPLQATELLRASCAARFAGGKTSSLVLGGRDGLPLQPGDLLPSPLYVASDADAPSTGTKVTGYDQSLRFSLLGSKDRLPSQYSLLPNIKCSL